MFLIFFESNLNDHFFVLRATASDEGVETLINIQPITLKDVFDNSENGIYAGLAKIISRGESQESILDNNNVNNNNIDVLNKIIKLLGD